MSWTSPNTDPNRAVYRFVAEHTNGYGVTGLVQRLNYADPDDLDPALADEVVADLAALISASPDFVAVSVYRVETTTSTYA